MGMLLSTVIMLLCVFGLKSIWDRYQTVMINVSLGCLRILIYPVVWLVKDKQMAERIRKEHQEWEKD